MADGTIPIRDADPGQDQAALQAVAREVATILTPSEEILFIALQNRTAISLKRDSVVATSNRLVNYRPSVLGRRDFADFPWEDVKDVRLKDGMLSSEVHVELIDGRAEVAGNLDKGQARRFYGIAQAKEQEWREKRRIRDLEEARARSGGIQMGAPSPQPSATAPAGEDPVEKLGKAKAMLDQGLISEAEYESVKAKIIASMT